MYLFQQLLLVYPKEERFRLCEHIFGASQALEEAGEEAELLDVVQIVQLTTTVKNYELSVFEAYGYTNTNVMPSLLEYLPPPLIGG